MKPPKPAPAPAPAPAHAPAPAPVIVPAPTAALAGVTAQPGHTPTVALNLPELAERTPEVAPAPDHSHLPESTQAEIEAGRKALHHHKSKASAEHSLGKRTVAQHEAAEARKPVEAGKPTSLSFPPNSDEVSAHDRRFK